MDVSEAIRNRRSIRKYAAKPVEREKLEAVLEAGRLAPSARNQQDWKFIAVTDDARRAELTNACCGQTFVGQAPAVLVVCALENRTMTCGQPAGTIDASIALSFMMLEAAEQGLGTCWLGSFYEDQVKKVLGIPASVRVVAVSPLGYPDESPSARPRRKFEEVAGYEYYG